MTAGQQTFCRHVSQRTDYHTMSMESFEQFRQIVLNDIVLQQRLRATTDHYSFVDLVVQAGEEHGCHFTHTDVDAAISANRKAWLQGRMVV